MIHFSFEGLVRFSVHELQFSVYSRPRYSTSLPSSLHRPLLITLIPPALSTSSLKNPQIALSVNQRRRVEVPSLRVYCAYTDPSGYTRMLDSLGPKVGLKFQFRWSPDIRNWQLTASDPVLVLARHENLRPTQLALACSPLIEDQAKRIP